MKRRKNLERAIVLGLILSTGVYGTAWADAITINDGTSTDISVDAVDGEYSRNYGSEDINVTGVGLLAAESDDPKVDKFTLTTTGDFNVMKESINGAGGSGVRGAIDFYNVNYKIDGTINANNIYLTHDESVDDGGGIQGINLITKGDFEENPTLTLNANGDVLFENFDESIVLQKNTSLTITAKGNINFNIVESDWGRLDYTTGINANGGDWQKNGSDKSDVQLNLTGTNINFNDMSRAIYLAGSNVDMSLIASNQIKIENTDGSRYNAIQFDNKNFANEADLLNNKKTVANLVAINDISINNYKNGINVNSDYMPYTAGGEINLYSDKIDITNTTIGISVASDREVKSGDNNIVKLDDYEAYEAKDDFERTNINTISASEKALNAAEKAGIILNAATNRVVGAEEAIFADSTANITLNASENYIANNFADEETVNGKYALHSQDEAQINVIADESNNIISSNEAIFADDSGIINVNGKQNYIANSFANEQTGNGSYAIHSNNKAEITVAADDTNNIIGDTEAVLAEERSTINITGKNNYIANSSGNTNGIATLSDKENYALHAVKGSTINLTAQDGGINNIQSEGFRTIYADGGKGLNSQASVNINGAINIINKNALNDVENNKIAVVASAEGYETTSEILKLLGNKGIVNIDLQGTQTDLSSQNIIYGSVIAGKNGIVNINSNLDGGVSTFSSDSENSKGSIAVYGNVMAGNKGELNLDLGAGGYLSGRVDDYQDADLKDDITFFNPEFSKEVSEAGKVNLTMGEGSTWDVTGQSWVTKLEGSGIIDMRNGAADETSHAVHIGELNGSHTFVMDLDTEHSVSDMLFIKDEASGEQKLWINSIKGYENLKDGDRLRFATVNDNGLTFSGDYTFGSYENAKNGIMLMDNGVKNNAFVINSDDYQLEDKENEDYNDGKEFDEVKPGDDYVDKNYENATNWFLEKYSAGDETSDTGKTIINMSKVNYNNAIYMDRLNKRLGEARYINPEEEQGMWVRIRHDRIGKDDAFRSQNTMYELGYDEKQDCDNGERRIGVALGYMDGNAEYSGIRGSGEVKRYGLWLYDTWLGDKGHYTDYVLKWGHLENDFDIYTMTRNEKVSGDYSNNVFSVSAEYGKKNDMGNDWYFEPQAQLQLARATGADYVTSQNTKVSVDGINSLIGRAGFRIGKDLGERSTVYVKADLLHEFLGDQTITAIDGTGALREEYENKGTWYDVGFGFATALGNNSYAFMDFEKSFGNDNDETYQINAGVQWTF